MQMAHVEFLTPGRKIEVTGMATIEEVKAEVLKSFEESQGKKAKTAWPIGLSAWQVEDEDGNVWTLSW